jgi:hypothetical protein
LASDYVSMCASGLSGEIEYECFGGSRPDAITFASATANSPDARATRRVVSPCRCRVDQFKEVVPLAARGFWSKRLVSSKVFGVSEIIPSLVLSQRTDSMERYGRHVFDTGQKRREGMSVFGGKADSLCPLRGRPLLTLSGKAEGAACQLGSSGPDVGFARDAPITLASLRRNAANSARHVFNGRAPARLI